MSTPLRKCGKCGLEAWITKDLDKFCNDKASKHKKRNLCRECNKKYLKNYEKKPPRPKLNCLRKCKDCEKEANTQEELDQFMRSNNHPHGRVNWCKDCFNIYQRENKYQEKFRERRKQEVIDNSPKPLRCYFCEGLITVLKGKTWESIAIHSLDGNHDNWNPPNKTPSHRGCHSRWHSTGDRHPKRRNRKKGG